MIPAGWHDDGTTLTAPNGVQVVLGFRAHVLSNTWDPNDYPLGPQYFTQQLEGSNPDLGPGDQIRFRKHLLGYPHNPTGRVANLKNTVIEEYIGVELQWQENLYSQIYAAYQALKAQQQAPQLLTDMQTIKAVAAKY